MPWSYINFRMAEEDLANLGHSYSDEKVKKSTESGSENGNSVCYVSAVLSSIFNFMF